MNAATIDSITALVVAIGGVLGLFIHSRNTRKIARKLVDDHAAAPHPRDRTGAVRIPPRDDHLTR